MPTVPTNGFKARRKPFGDINRTKQGKKRRRLNAEGKLHLLNLTMGLGELSSLVASFQRLFAFRYSQAITTRVGQPRGWRALGRKLEKKDILRHLLGNRHPCGPQWFGARSLHTTRFFCLDVDYDETAEQHIIGNLADEGANAENGTDLALHRLAKPINGRGKHSFYQRCRKVEDALSRLGIDPGDPAQVLIQSTPRGGRHYYVFLAQSFFVDQCRELLAAAGLNFKSGQVEFYPSTKQGLRLPFGHIPGQRHDPDAWIRFIQDFEAGRIRRFTLAELHNHFYTSASAALPTTEPSRRPSLSRHIAKHAIPRHCVTYPADCQRSSHYDQLVEYGPATPAEATALLQLGIQEEGTRTACLKHLAAHFIWIKGYTADTATQLLTDWAMNARHRSKDIHADLANGTRQVAAHIARLTKWYEDHKNTDRPCTPSAKAEFAEAEIAHLAMHIQHLPHRYRHLQARFLLSFLRFAKRYGWRSEDGQGWEAAVAVSVMRGWDGCSGKRQKDRCDLARQLKLLTITRHHWHNLKGKGRPTTYQLLVPSVPAGEWVMTYEEALVRLVNSPSGVQGQQADRSPASQQSVPATEQNHERSNLFAANDQGSAAQPRRAVPLALRQATSRIDLGASPRQCPPQPTPPSRLPGNDLERLRASASQDVLKAFDRLPPLPSSYPPATRRLLDQARLRTLLLCPELVAELLPPDSYTCSNSGRSPDLGPKQTKLSIEQNELLQKLENNSIETVSILRRACCASHQPVSRKFCYVG